MRPVHLDMETVQQVFVWWPQVNCDIWWWISFSGLRHLSAAVCTRWSLLSDFWFKPVKGGCSNPVMRRCVTKKKHKEKMIGPRIEPWGTPQVRDFTNHVKAVSDYQTTAGVCLTGLSESQQQWSWKWTVCPEGGARGTRVHPLESRKELRNISDL